MKSNYEVIVFDLGNTLIRFDHTIAAKVLADRFRLDAKKVYDTFFDSPFTRSFETGVISPEAFHRTIMEFFGMELPLKEFAPIWNNIFWEDRAMCQLARDLKRSYRLFLFSNINKLHFDYIAQKFDIIKIFDELILSFEVGAIKPQLAMFNEVIRRAGGRRDSILYIDDREDLISEARQLGIDAIRHTTVDELYPALRERNILFDNKVAVC